jgi:hypothetical protein
MDQHEIDRIKALCAQATPGPWEWTPNGHLTATAVEDDDYEYDNQHFKEAGEPSGVRYKLIVVNDTGIPHPDYPNNKFLAEARTVVPRLIEALEDARAQLLMLGVGLL